MSTVARYWLKWDSLVLTSITGRIREERVIRFIRRISQSADGQAYPAVLLLVALIQYDRWRILGTFFISFAIELAVYKTVKNLVKRPRPFHRRDGPINLIVPQDVFSFPSGHTAGAFVVALSVAYCFPWLSLPACLWAALVGFSRVYLGVHYPTDVLAGACLGILSVKAGLLIGNCLIVSSIF
jgi:undecaprenyl-diphosphatase